MLARRVWRRRPDPRLCVRAVGDRRRPARARRARCSSFYGQHEHRKLMLAAVAARRPRRLLRAPSRSAPASACADAHAGCARSRRALDGRCASSPPARERELDLLAFELDEIESVAPSEDEASELAGRARAAAPPRDAAAARRRRAPRRSRPRTGTAARPSCSLRAAAQLAGAAAIDPALDGLAERVAGARRSRPRTLAAALRSLRVRARGRRPGRLEEVEERLALFARLERKHGGSIADVLAHADRCRARREELERAEIALAEVEASLAEAARASSTALAGELSARRREAAPALAAAVRERLAELAMADAEFEVEVRPRADGCGPRGADDGRARDRAEPGDAGGAAAGDRLGRRAVAGDAGDPERGPRRAPTVASHGRRRCSCSTRSTPASAATPPARSASTCGRSPRGGRSSASPTCRRWRRWPTATSRSPRTRPRCRRARPCRARRRRGRGRARPDAGRGRGRPRRQPPRPAAAARGLGAAAPASCCALRRAGGARRRQSVALVAFPCSPLSVSDAGATFKRQRPDYTREATA